MKLKDKIKNFINVTDDDYIDSNESDYNDDFDFEPEPAAPAQETRETRRSASNSKANSKSEKSASKSNSRDNVVDINSSKAAASQPKPHVVFQKIDRFEEAGEVADILKEKRIVILNLETCPNDVSQRILDFLYGVAYANHGDFKRVAGRAYIITPYNVPISGELLDELGGAE